MQLLQKFAVYLIYNLTLTNKDMEFKSIYDACAELMYEAEIPTKVIIEGNELTILVYGNGTFEIIK